jgi:hypothetical protein
MAESSNFWKGVVTGAVVTATVAGFLKQIHGSGTTSHRVIDAIAPHPFRDHAEKLILKRESSESAGDPARLSSARSRDMVTTFERSGGAPGPSHEPEVLETPGHPGQSLDHSDASQPVRPATQTLRTIHK